MKKQFLFSMVILFSTVALGQSQFSGWSALFSSVKTGKKTSIHADFQFRSSASVKFLQTTLLRTGLNYHFNKKMIGTVGYAFISNRKVLGSIVAHAPEHRIWQQFIYQHKLKNVAVAHRFRLEQRFIANSTLQNNQHDVEGYLFASRVRYFIRNVLPFKKETVFSKGPFAALQNELFLNIGNTKNVNGKTFDQNRFYIATGYRINPKTDLEIGYINQYVNGKAKAFSNNHALQLAAYLRL